MIQPDFWTEPEEAIRRAYEFTDWAVLCQDGVAKQLSVDHEPNKERKVIEEKGGFVIKYPGIKILKL